MVNTHNSPFTIDHSPNDTTRKFNQKSPRRRIGAMDEKKYWQSFGDLNKSEAWKQSGKDEFSEELLPFEDIEGSILDAKTPRRDFLKYLGFSTAAAAIAAGCEIPVRKTVPFLNKKDDIIAGIPNYYATTYVNEGDVIPVVVKHS